MSSYRKTSYKRAFALVLSLLFIVSTVITLGTSTVNAAATGVPGKPALSHNNWDKLPNYTITMNMWWGNNGTSWKLYENDVVIYTGTLVDNTSSAQTASYAITNKSSGNFNYKCELINSFGSTFSDVITVTVAGSTTPPDLPLPATASGAPASGYVIASENATDIEWQFYVANPNKSYAWDGKFFNVWMVSFETSCDITSVTGVNSFVKNGSTVTMFLNSDSRVLSYGETVLMTVKAKKAGTSVAPSNVKVHQMRGDMPYPQAAGLPSSWAKNKAALTAADLIANSQQYYSATVPVSTNHLIMHNLQNPTQLIISQPAVINYPVNTVNGLRIRVPSRYAAMGLGFAQEIFKINPHYMVGLGTKENFAYGVVPPSAGNTMNPVVIDGQTWYWPIQIAHPDGPYQQEVGNFNECKGLFPDYLAETAQHPDYVKLTTGADSDSKFASATISSAISLTMTREFLYGLPVNKFKEFVEQAADKWAEYTCVNYAYNRGVYGFLQLGIFTTNRQTAITTTNIAAQFNLSGFASHTETVRTILETCNNDLTNIYDTQLTWAEVNEFFNQLKLFYKQGVPSDAEWTAMIADVNKAFNVLAQHWGGSTVSLRYDFLTLLRVAKAYLPQSYNPNPSGQTWADQCFASNGGFPPAVTNSGTTLPLPLASTVSISPTTSTGSYTVTIQIPANSNAASMTLFEGTASVYTQAVSATSASTITRNFTGKAPGSYSYSCQLTNSTGSTASNTANVTVEGQPVPVPLAATVSVDNATNTGSYTITVQVPANSNASSLTLYEGTAIALSQSITSSAAQTVTKSYTGKAANVYEYTCQLTNSAGSSTSNKVTVTVQSGGQTVNPWAPGISYKQGDPALYNGVTYECLQPHTSMVGWEPANVPALWKVK